MKHRIIILSPVRGCDKNLRRLYDSIQPSMSDLDLWLIVHDNQDAWATKDLKGVNVKLLFNNAEPGAGNTRNVGLEYVREKIDGPFIIYPLDADDSLAPNMLETARKAFETYDEYVISFGHRKIFKNKIISVGWDEKFTLLDQLKRYRTPCGSTFVKFDSTHDMDGITFGKRKRANDQIFFLNAIRKNKTFRCIKQPVMDYNVQNTGSVSGKKYKMPLYKFLTLRDFGLSPLTASYFTFRYLFVGIMRHIFKVSY